MTIYKHIVEGPGPAGDIWTTSMHTNSAQDIDTVHGAFVTAAQSFYNVVMATRWTPETSATSVRTYQLSDPGFKQVAVRDSVVSWVGVDTGQALPQRVAVVVSLRTATPTRAGRGRFYVPAVSSSFLAETGEMTTVAAGDIATGAAAMITGLATTATAIVFHRLGGYTVINQVLVSPVFGTQRRRSNKVPSNYQSADV